MAIKGFQIKIKERTSRILKKSEITMEQQVVYSEELKKVPVSLKLKDNLDFLQDILGSNNDIVFRSFHMGMNKGNPGHRTDY